MFRSQRSFLRRVSKCSAHIPCVSRHCHDKLHTDFVTATNHRYPVIHPIFAFYKGQTTPSLMWDLSIIPDSFDALAASAYVPLLPEEFSTLVTHPPIPSITLALACVPSLQRKIQACGPNAGLTLRELIAGISDWTVSRLSAAQWTALSKDSRDSARAAYQRRTGGIYRFAGVDETPYVVFDVLGTQSMFLSLERKKGYRTKDGACIYWVHTTTRGRCKKWR
jgi:hypothetical protein